MALGAWRLTAKDTCNSVHLVGNTPRPATAGLGRRGFGYGFAGNGCTTRPIAPHLDRNLLIFQAFLAVHRTRSAEWYRSRHPTPSRWAVLRPMGTGQERTFLMRLT